MQEFALFASAQNVLRRQHHWASITSIQAMAPSRAYIPSRALLRALSRPLSSRCPFVRPLPTQFSRGKRIRAIKLENDELKPNIPGAPGLKFPKSVEEADKLMQPPPDHVLDDPDIPVITWYEQNLDNATSERLVQRIATPEDRRKHNELSRMLEEDSINPNYDDAMLNRRLLDDLMKDPNFADLAGELHELKSGIMTREESKALNEQIRNEQEPELKELEAGLRMATHDSIQELINDPDLADARSELLDLRDKMPDTEDSGSEEFQTALQRVEEKLSGNKAFQKKLAILQAQYGTEAGELSDAEQEVLDFDEDAPVETPEDLDKLLLQMKDLMGSMGGDKQIQDELDAVIREDPFANAEGDIEREVDFKELSQELGKLAQSANSPETPPLADENGEKIGPELEAKVNRIMQDPKLMEKLMYIQNTIIEEQRKAADITSIPHEIAPDPTTIDPSRITNMQQRIELARNDPDHITAMRRLRVNLLPPFNIAPALKSFNQAIELAYLGANDDIRRILWRAYSRTRTLPTFLQNLSDDAWDLLYYSQAVNWGANQNRQNHLKMLLHDLKSVGRDGPPTHPSTLIEN